MKPVTFSNFKKLKGLSLNDFNRWVSLIYKSGFQDGIDKSEEDVVAELDEDALMKALLSVDGIGEVRAKKAVNAILMDGRRNLK